MQINANQWGRFGAGGVAIQRPTHDALTGQKLVAPGVSHRIEGTPLFYKLTSTSNCQITGDQRRAIEAAIRSAASQAQDTAAKAAGLTAEADKPGSDAAGESVDGAGSDSKPVSAETPSKTTRRRKK